MHADQYYLFRHAVLRDAAYLLHTPALRGTLHRVALEQFERELDVELSEPGEKLNTDPLPVDPLMGQLATHARYAQDEPYANLELLKRSEAGYLMRAGNHAERQYDHAQAIAVWRRLADISKGEARFAALQKVSQTSRVLSRMRDGFAACDEALELARRELANRNVVLALAEKGLAHWFDDEPEIAQQCLEEAVSRFDSEVSKSLEANTLGLLGMVYEQHGRTGEFEELSLRALELLRESGDRFNEGVMYQNLGATMLDSGRLEEGERYLTQAIAIHEELNDDTNLAIGLNNLSMLESQRGNYKLAIEYTERSMPLLVRVGNRRSLGYCYAARGTALRRTGDLPNARTDMIEALAIHREAGNLSGESACMCDLGLIELLLGNREAGQGLWSKGLASVQRLRGKAGVKMYMDDLQEACATAGIKPFE